ncbi:MAG: dTMP kinase [Candidatus Nomurabacteria bacterium]|jgi:dTMP kinase|nr:dTMP kinase [Candidatus Nomurabacteria bacterium]
MKTGKYIVIEGQDGVGKSTQVELLARFLRGRAQDVLTTREPGGGLPATDTIRNLLKNKDHNLDSITHTLLFTANRRELWTKVIEPALAAGKTVISDRNWWSTIAFEHYGMDVPLELVENLTKSCLPKRYVRPDFGLVMTLGNAERQRRLGGRDNNSKNDSYESRNDDFQRRVIDGYLEIAKNKQLLVIDASPSPEEIHRQIVSLLHF